MKLMFLLVMISALASCDSGSGPKAASKDGTQSTEAIPGSAKTRFVCKFPMQVAYSPDATVTFTFDTVSKEALYEQPSGYYVKLSGCEAGKYGAIFACNYSQKAPSSGLSDSTFESNSYKTDEVINLRVESKTVMGQKRFSVTMSESYSEWISTGYDGAGHFAYRNYTFIKSDACVAEDN